MFERKGKVEITLLDVLVISLINMSDRGEMNKLLRKFVLSIYTYSQKLRLSSTNLNQMFVSHVTKIIRIHKIYHCMHGV